MAFPIELQWGVTANHAACGMECCGGLIYLEAAGESGQEAIQISQRGQDNML